MLRSIDRLDAGQVADVLDLAATARAVDGNPPMSEQAELQLRGGAGRHVLARDDDGSLAGYALVSGDAAEAVVHPSRRRAGVGRAVVEAVLAAVRPGGVSMWSHGDHPGAAALAAELGFERVRDLWLMRRRWGPELPPLVVPDGVTLRPFEPGADDADWLRVNARAFASQPEQGAWTAPDLAARQAEPWFDPSGFIVAQDASSGQMLGSHWTKVHTEGPDPFGEVYVVGVDPSAQGRRLGGALTLAGLHHLRGLGLDTVVLYVESDNAAALRVYTGLGFEHASTDAMYRR